MAWPLVHDYHCPNTKQVGEVHVAMTSGSVYSQPKKLGSSTVSAAPIRPYPLWNALQWSSDGQVDKGPVDWTEKPGTYRFACL